MRSLRKLSLGTKGLTRAGNSLRPLALEHKRSPSQCEGNQARQAGNWPAQEGCGPVGIV